MQLKELIHRAANDFDRDALVACLEKKRLDDGIHYMDVKILSDGLCEQKKRVSQAIHECRKAKAAFLVQRDLVVRTLVVEQLINKMMNVQLEWRAYRRISRQTRQFQQVYYSKVMRG